MVLDVVLHEKLHRTYNVPFKVGPCPCFKTTIPNLGENSRIE